jgi:hypothetical protein
LGELVVFFDQGFGFLAEGVGCIEYFGDLFLGFKRGEGDLDF